jgi:hypothetical protein
MLPTFLVIGAQKAGTTALHQYLRAHPETLVSRPKELKFFLAEGNWARGVGWYRQQFEVPDDHPPPKAIGETSPDYTRFPRFSGVPERIASLVPDVRLVYLVRDPVERIRSAYQHALASGVEHRPIDVAVHDEASYLDDSRYAAQLDRYLACFDPAQLLVIDSDALRTERPATLTRIAYHLGIDPHRFPAPAIAREAYTSTDRGAHHRWAVRARRLPGVDRIWSVTPDRARARLRARVERPVGAGELRLAPDTVAWIRTELASDRARLLERVPSAAAWW